MTRNSEHSRNTHLAVELQKLKKQKCRLQMLHPKARQQPDIILIQEVHGSHTIPGYTAFGSPSITYPKRRAQQSTTPILTLTLVHNSIPAIQIDTCEWNTETQGTVAVQANQRVRRHH